MATPLVLGLGVPELLIILAVVLLLFGGARLAGIGKSTGRAIKEFKEETKGLRESDANRTEPDASGTRPQPPYLSYPNSTPEPAPDAAPNPSTGEPRRDG
jgi:sec-independent protein translocase protein TatA